MAIWSDKRVLVTGGAGFLGSFVVENLTAKGCREIVVPRSCDYDLRTAEAVMRLYRDAMPHLVIHLAAVVGGIGANREQPATFFYENLMMGTLLMEYCRRFNISKFVAIGTICAYPKHTSVPFNELDLWDGYPEETNAPYGLAKKMLLVQAQAYRQQYGTNAIFLLPTNLFGPRDNFDPKSSHVIPAIIEKCQLAIEAGEKTVTLWGDGTATREFLFVADAAEAIVLAAGCYDGAEPVNIGTGVEVSVRELASMIAGLMGFEGEFLWDTSSPNGQPRRCLDVSRAPKLFGFTAAVGLEEGLRTTVNWYLRTRTNTTDMERV